MNSIAATIIILIELPTLVLTWLILALRGTRPILLREESSSGRHAEILRFNVKDDHWTSRRIRGLSLDLSPIFFDVVSGRLSCIEGVRLMNHIAKDRSQVTQPLGVTQVLRIAGLFILAAVILWIAWQPF
jgi:lipopolysaccharide/colanic/teichoic acid biosynthesis glycosyltransferase